MTSTQRTAPERADAEAAGTVAAHRRPAGWEAGALAAVLLLFAGGLGVLVVIPLTLGHDESVYALWARNWVFGTPDTGISAHRAPGVPVLAAPLVAVSTAEPVLRLVGVVAGVAAVAATWWAGRSMAGPVAGLTGALLVASSPTVLAQAPTLLSDVPAMAVILVGVGVIWREFERPRGPTWWLVTVAPIGATAYYIRYGSAVVLAAVAAGAAVAWLPRLLRGWRPVAATGGLFIALLLPHFVGAVRELDHPLGRLTSARDIALAHTGGMEGVQSYFADVPDALAGPLAGAAMIVAVVAGVARLVISLVRRRWGRDERLTAFVLVAAGVHIVLVGSQQFPEPRYILVSIALLLLLFGREVAAIAGLAARRSSPVPVGMVLAGVALAVTVYGAWNVAGLREDRMIRQHDREAFLAAAAYIREHSGEDCEAITGHTPFVTWYAECAAYRFGNEEQVAEAGGWLLLVDRGRQPESEELEEVLEMVEGPVATFIDPMPQRGRGDVEVYRFP